MDNALEIKGLSKEYKDFRLDNVSFEVPSGSIVGLIGENGSGKTTIIKLILNMIKKNGGEVTVLGKNKGISDIKNEIGVVMDEPGFPGFLNAKEINRIMKNIFSNWSEDTFFGYLKKLKVPDNKEYKDMSKGTKMKTGIAVALSHNPRLLILDEATNGLDPVVRSEVNEIFTEFTRDESHSILISSHIVSDLDRICDYIVFIHNGKLMLFEEKDRLLEKYCIVHCTREQLSSIERSKIIGRKENKYDISVLMEKSQVKSGFSTSPVDIEELFVFMAKEDN
ncbi:MAG: ABC transporter ATP-binding protein [Clostridia bacterium]|nr:ABC transporter ATP-binding protein [Clostridia bacterium]